MILYIIGILLFTYFLIIIIIIIIIIFSFLVFCTFTVIGNLCELNINK